MSLRDSITRSIQPISIETGKPVTDVQMSRIDAINDAAKELFWVLHDVEGSSRDNEGFQTRRMSIAATHLETAMLYARLAAMETK
jgi:hypothetical protein